MKPFYFNAVFWGKVHRQYFLDLLVASLLSPKNIPALDPSRKSKFLIATTSEDWESIQSQYLFQKLKEYVVPFWFEMPVPHEDDSKMLVMSSGHKQIAMKTFQDSAYGIYLSPDAVLSDGSVSTLERLSESGKKVVLSAAFRISQDPFLEEMKQSGFYKPGSPIILPPRDCVRVALRHLHTETRRYEFNSKWFSDTPILVYWKVPNQSNDIIIYSFSWAPLLVDYESIRNHDVSTFNEWTLDGDYISRNFSADDDIHVVTDSDEIIYASLTKESDYHFELVPEITKLFSWYKMWLIKKLKDSPIMDDLKRKIFRTPVFLHSSDISSEWIKHRRFTQKIIASSYKKDYRLWLLDLFFSYIAYQKNKSLNLVSAVSWTRFLVIDPLTPLLRPTLRIIGLDKFISPLIRNALEDWTDLEVYIIRNSEFALRLLYTIFAIIAVASAVFFVWGTVIAFAVLLILGIVQFLSQ